MQGHTVGLGEEGLEASWKGGSWSGGRILDGGDAAGEGGGEREQDGGS